MLQCWKGSLSHNTLYLLNYILCYILSFMQKKLFNAAGRVHMTTEYDTVNNWVYNNWIGPQDLASVMAGSEAGLKLLRKHSCSLLLNDNRHTVEHWDYAVEWVVAQWLPRALAAGLTHYAQVIRAESPTSLSADVLYRAISEQVEMRVFISLAEAQDWLQKVRRKG
ncbi:hypothetical protein PK28_10260 [Hymenobacter sp. DG25B]|nr:hypothetical protein PK28_10260 [Hymenobacter sp. DG25B]